MTFLILAAGLVLLILGAELLVRGASRAAAALGISPLVVGLTVVAYGTSSPELAVSVSSSLAGQGSLALGNVVGSNIFNVLFILGLSALVAPLVVARQLVRLDVPLMIAVSLLALLLGLDGHIGRIDGLLLTAGILLYTGFLLRQGRREGRESAAGEPPARPGWADWLRHLGLVVGGLALLVLGSRWLVASAIELSRQLGLSELVIGLTLVAAGTSLPEVATSVVATFRGERDIAVGNVVDSNVFNLLGVLGLSGLVAPTGLEVSATVLRFDLPVMIAVALACLPIFFTGHRIDRWEGGLFLAYYVAYTAYLVLAAAHHESVAAIRAGMLFFVLPLTAMTLAILAIRALRTQRSS